MGFFAKLNSAISKRSHEWGNTEKPSIEFRGLELAGEAGEACNEIKKIARGRLGMLGSKQDTTALADELGDVIICCQLVAREFDIDLQQATIDKFNKTSDKYGMKTRIETCKSAR